MYKLNQNKTKRKRGVVLTSTGIKRLQSAIISLEIVEKKAKPFTLEELSDRMEVSTRTLGKLWSLSVGVDQKTIKLCFSALNLELHSEDYTTISEGNETETSQLLSLSSYTKEDSYQFSLVNSFVKEHPKKTEQIENFWS
jgi:hypothetical protein